MYKLVCIRQHELYHSLRRYETTSIGCFLSPCSTRSASFGAPVDDNTAEDSEIADLSVSWSTMVIIGLPDSHLPKCRDVSLDVLPFPI